MVSKKILAVAIAAALSSQAYAINLDDDSDAVKYAKEAITTNDQIGTSAYYFVTGADLVVENKLGFGVSAADVIYVRYDLTNAQFGGDVGAVLGGIGASDVEVAQGGLEGDSYVIFAVTTDANYGQTNVLSLDLSAEGLGIKPTSAIGVSYAMYETKSAAVAKTGSLASSTYASAITVANALTTTFVAASNSVADVATDFTSFTDGDDVTLGTVTLNLDTTALLPNGDEVAALSDVVDTTADTSFLQITGDISFADDVTIGGVAADEDGAVDITTLTFGVDYDVDLSVDGETTINPGDYSVASDYAQIEDGVYGVGVDSGALASITRNGTQIYIANFSTVADYNQRLVLVNRSAKPAPYSISFTTEAGVTATPGAKATGTLAANSTTSLKAVDVVTLAGPVSRTAATVNVTAQKSNIDAATTLVNTVTKSTDTVKLDNN